VMECVPSRFPQPRFRKSSFATSIPAPSCVCSCGEGHAASTSREELRGRKGKGKGIGTMTYRERPQANICGVHGAVHVNIGAVVEVGMRLLGGAAHSAL